MKSKISTKKFFGYQARYIIRLYKGENKYSEDSFTINIYSTEADKKTVLVALHKGLKDKSYNLVIESYSTREQDLRTKEFIVSVMNIDEHRIENWKDFASFEYESDPTAEDYKFELGDVVVRSRNEEGELVTEVGVVLQVHRGNEVRTDMFGNECEDRLSFATKRDIEKYAPDIIEHLKF